jgi:hydroxyacylglutathione hydrolase
MIRIHKFEFNPFQENTYVVYDETRDCAIVDPGCMFAHEQTELKDFIDKNQLNPVILLNTHAHIDHVVGNAYVYRTWNLAPYLHKEDLEILHGLSRYAEVFGIGNIEDSPEPSHFMEEGEIITFGKSEFEVIFVPGHAPGHVAFQNREEKIFISGDVIMQGSIGRTDLPGGSMNVLAETLIKKILPLEDEYRIYPGHGPVITMKDERRHNPYLQDHFLAQFS